MSTPTPIAYYMPAPEGIDEGIAKILDTLSESGIKVEVIGDPSRVRESLYTVLFLLKENTGAYAARIACRTSRSTLLIYTTSTVSDMLYVKDLLESRGRKLHTVLVENEADILDRIRSYIRGYRAAAASSDMRILLFGVDYDDSVLGTLNSIVEPDYYVFAWNEASDTIDEGIKYSSLYIDTYLSAYFDVKGKDEEKLSKSLGLYLAIKSVLDNEGANAVLIDCNRIYSSKGFTPWITMNLLLDEGIPASCMNRPLSLLVHAVSLALTGKPAWEPYMLKIKDGKLLLMGKLAPTLLFKQVSLIDKGGYYELTGQIRESEYILVSLSPGRMMVSLNPVKVESYTKANNGVNVAVNRASLWENLLSDKVYLMPITDIDSLRVSFESLNFKPIPGT